VIKYTLTYHGIQARELPNDEQALELLESGTDGVT
jgi:hypothetical protein